LSVDGHAASATLQPQARNPALDAAPMHSGRIDLGLAWQKVARLVDR